MYIFKLGKNYLKYDFVGRNWKGERLIDLNFMNSNYYI